MQGLLVLLQDVTSVPAAEQRLLARVSLVVLDNVWDRSVIPAFDCGFKLVITT